MTDNEWTDLIIIINAVIIGGGTIFSGIEGGTVGVGTYLLSISSFGLLGESGVLTPLLSAILAVLNIKGLILIAKYIRGIAS